MLQRKQLTESQARYAMEHGEFDESVRTAADHVVVMLTQGWCPQWTSMDVWLRSMERKGEPADFDLVIFEFIYDKVSFFDEFRTFKETTWQNAEIPYMRYYYKGSLTGSSNYLPSRTFMQYVRQGTEQMQR